MRNGALAIILLAAAGVAQRRSTEYINPVIPGDHPDPSLIRVGSSYWATSTSGEWAPVFPLLHSEDLVNWTTEGFVLPEPPAWSAGRYWAPEISEYQGQFYVYYAARKKNGPLCVAVAKSAKPEGPYTDYGPIVCQDDGSIDPMAAVDDNGHRYLIWKEDGNSRGGPTPIWAQELSDDGTKLTGERTELIRNDAPWEGPVVEGPFILRRHGYFYLFYSGAVCCGSGCNYQMGVARSEHLLGPWKKDPDNPILAGTDVWKCPGHGSIVEDPTGRDYLLYHGYNQAAFLFLGREALLDEVKWNRKEWPVINGNKGPSNKTASPFHTAQPFTEPSFHDQFEKSGLNPRWQWPWNNEPLAVSGGGWLTLRPECRSCCRSSRGCAGAVSRIHELHGACRVGSRFGTSREHGGADGICEWRQCGRHRGSGSKIVRVASNSRRHEDHNEHGRTRRNACVSAHDRFARARFSVCVQRGWSALDEHGRRHVRR